MFSSQLWPVCDCVSPLHDQAGKFRTQDACASDHNKKLETGRERQQETGRERHKRLDVRDNKRLDVLLFVFVASYFLCCGDVESNPGPLEKDDLEPQARKEPRDDASRV